MKKITLLFLLFSFLSYSQDKPNGTTIEEYNYMSKGYKIQLDSGLDMKKGYRVENFYQYDSSPYFFDFKACLRDDNTLAGIILVSTSSLWGNVYYNCIPVDNNELSSNFTKRLDDWDEPMVTAYSNAATALMSNLYKIYSNNINKK